VVSEWEPILRTYGLPTACLVIVIYAWLSGKVVSRQQYDDMKTTQQTTIDRLVGERNEAFAKANRSEERNAELVKTLATLTDQLARAQQLRGSP